VNVINTASFLSILTGFRTQPHARGYDADGEERSQAVFKSIDERVRKVASKEDAILKDRSRSQEGQQQLLAALGNESAPDFAGPSRVIRDIDEADARLVTLLFAAIRKRPAGLDPSEAYGREKEIRQAVGKSEATVTFLHALEGGDLETARALLDVPGASWLADDIIQRGQNEYARRTNPAAFEKHQAIAVLREHLVSLREMIRQWLIGGLGADPAVVEKALKG
jgi:hypothetical protein